LPLACQHKVRFGGQSCVTDCPATGPAGVFEYVKVLAPEDVPPFDPRIVDVAVLDMNHGWPNLGHDSLIHAVQDAACDLLVARRESGLRVRALSYDVRRSLQVPDLPGDRFSVYLGTGGPGHIDPAGNDGTSEGSQGIKEDPSWQAPAFRLFDAIAAEEKAALLGVCHTFGVMCRWSGAAAPVLRGPHKGKSSGVLENVLTAEARRHPWFRHFSEELPDRRRLRVVENRLFDLIPTSRGFAPGLVPIGYETEGVGGAPGDAVTMIEFARDAGGVMPRIFAVNHHPEIVDRFRQMMILGQKLDRGEVTNEWYQERAEILTRTYPDENSDRRLHVTSDFTLLAPLRFHLGRALRLRGEALGLPFRIHEDSVLTSPDPMAVVPGSDREAF
jgi:hypothetical protein